MSYFPRFHCPCNLAPSMILSLPAGTARHVQVRRLQPNDVITLFNGEGGEYTARIQHMGRSDVQVQVETKSEVDRELPFHVSLWSGMIANERMDWLLEKATELGAAKVLPIMAERSVLKLKGERADKKLAHWQAIAVAASEQCGRNRVLQVLPALSLSAALMEATETAPLAHRWVLSLAKGAQSLQSAITSLSSLAPKAVILLSGPEGGLSPEEEARALAAGFKPVSLGTRVLRAETAPVAVLSALGALG